MCGITIVDAWLKSAEKEDRHKTRWCVQQDFKYHESVGYKKYGDRIKVNGQIDSTKLSVNDILEQFLIYRGYHNKMYT